MTHNLQENKILVTGASSSLGSQILFELNKQNIKPIAHVRESSDTTHIDSLGLEKREVDFKHTKPIKLKHFYSCKINLNYIFLPVSFLSI